MADIRLFHSIKCLFIVSFLATSTGLFFQGCALYRPHPVHEVPFYEQAQVKKEGRLEVSVAIPSRSEAKKILGVDVEKRGMQAVWIQIKNEEKDPYYFFHRSVDPDYFTADEAALINRFRLIEKGRLLSFKHMMLFPVNAFRYPHVNDEMQKHFQERGMHNTIVFPGDTISGFVYTPLDKGTKKVPIHLFSRRRGDEDQEKKFLFFIEVPGLKVDYSRKNLDELYADDEWLDLDRNGLKGVLEESGCCTTNKKGTKDGDPMNLVLIGELQEILDAFALAHWDETEVISWSTTGKMIKAFFLWQRVPLFSDK